MDPLNPYEGYEAYKTYVAIKSHFSSSYDYFKYGGKVRCTQESFLKRKDKFFFRKLAKKYSNQELVNYIVANFVHNDGKTWVGGFSDKPYMKQQKIMQSLTYNFERELEGILKQFEDPNEPFKHKQYTHPEIVKAYIRGDVSLESLCILDDMLNFTQLWVRDDAMINTVCGLIKNYKPFVQYDKQKMKNIIMSILNEA